MGPSDVAVPLSGSSSSSSRSSSECSVPSSWPSCSPFPFCRWASDAERAAALEFAPLSRRRLGSGSHSPSGDRPGVAAERRVSVTREVCRACKKTDKCLERSFRPSPVAKMSPVRRVERKPVRCELQQISSYSIKSFSRTLQAATAVGFSLENEDDCQVAGYQIFQAPINSFPRRAPPPITAHSQHVPSPGDTHTVVCLQHKHAQIHGSPREFAPRVVERPKPHCLLLVIGRSRSDSCHKSRLSARVYCWRNCTKV